MKKIILGILLLLILGLISGCKSISCIFKFETDKIDCLQNLALENNDESYCKKIGIESDEIECFLSLALKNNDESYCDRITWEEKNLKNWNRASCLSKYSVLKNKPDICTSLSEYESLYTRCLKGLAKIRGDIEFCEELTGDDLRRCIRNVAIAKNDITVCDSIKGGSVIKDRAFVSSSQDCIESVAFSSLNKELCNQLADDNSISKCINKIEGYIRNEQNCKEEQGREADICWRNLADWINNFNYCDNISDNEMKQDCIERVLLIKP